MKEQLTLEKAYYFLKCICDTKNKYTPDDVVTKNFLPIKIFSAIIDNDKYDINNFSKEIEDSEKNNISECINFKVKYYDCVWGRWDSKENEEKFERMKNSKKWEDNHSKGSPYKVDFSFAWCMCQCHCVKESGELGEKVIKWRDYDNEQNKKIIKDYFEKKEKEGIKIYEIF